MTSSTSGAPIVDRVRALGPDAGFPETLALFEPMLAVQPRDGVEVLADLAYGPHPRHRVDVFRPSPARDGAHDAPVLVFLHGGGFVRGDKSMRANIGYWGARQGFVVALPNYRLAPEARWPSGPQDVARLERWLADEARTLGGDPGRIVLAGESAGAAHVAGAALIRAFQPAGWRIRGVALLSGPYDAALEARARDAFDIASPDPRNDAYFGPAQADHDAGSIVDQIDARPLPVWIAFAEQDLLQMQVQAGQLFAALVRRHGFSPRIDRLRGHNHFSPGCSIGTAEAGVADRLAAFVRSVAARPG